MITTEILIDDDRVAWLYFNGIEFLIFNVFVSHVMRVQNAKSYSQKELPWHCDTAIAFMLIYFYHPFM